MRRLDQLSRGRGRGMTLLLACAIGAQAVVLQLVLRTPFLYDDGANQNLKGYLIDRDQTFPGFVSKMVHGQLTGLGRFAPLGLYENYGLMDVLHDRMAYKLLLVVLTIAATLAVARVLVVLGVPAAIALLGAGLTSALYQLHAYHDALYAYGGLMQLVALLLCGSLLLFIRWLRGGRWWLLAASMLLVVAADLAYEASYLLVVFHVAVVLVERQPLRRALAPLAVSGAFVVLTVYLRLKYVGGGQAYSIDAAPGKVVPAFLKQLSATLPLTNFLDPHGPKAMASSGSRTPIARGVLVGLLLLPLLWAAGRAAREWRPGGRLVLTVVLIAVTLIAMPAALVAAAVRYQTELRWGVGYLPVFFGVVGVGTLAALLYALAARRVPLPALAIGAAALLAVLAGRNAEGNTRVVASLEPIAHMRDDLDDALRHGLLDDVGDDRLLLFDQGDIAPPAGFWVAGYAMTMKQWVMTITDRRPRASAEIESGHPLAERCPAPAAPGARCPLLRAPATWFRTAVADGHRWVLLTPVRARRFTAATDLYRAPGGPTARLAVRGLGGRTVTVRWSTAAAPVVDGPAGGRVVARGGDWTFLDVAVPDGAAAASGTVLLGPAS